MKGVIRGTGKATKYLIDGREVTKKAFDQIFPDKPLGDGSGLISWKPLHSDALGGHLALVEELSRASAENQIPATGEQAAALAATKQVVVTGCN